VRSDGVLQQGPQETRGGGGRGNSVVSFNVLCILHGMKSCLMTLMATTKNDENHEQSHNDDTTNSTRRKSEYV